ncbi:fibronectin type-III domain-containing protein 3A-like isoform X2 [Paramacrobiotus metropolitanus]|uniref:fibronectin type-III domain-containing protein 3A-like isoform X2 n=1 Tax=Paramacrobiotus metropolitanus TaxID=2943436 RepID=UPI002445DCFB|nr:fibronectin type-III domain-containing protein 3A-like isoform X2 [Paramacrobiotus metropolitanus]
MVVGPASVTIMSNCSNPPTAIPVTVPPGQYVQQLIDDHGVLRSVYISNQPYPDGATLEPFQHSYYVPAQMQLQMPIHAASFPAQYPVSHAVPLTNGMQQNGYATQPSTVYPPDYHHHNYIQQPQNPALLDDRNYAARQKLKKKFERKRPMYNSNGGAGNRRYNQEFDNDNQKSNDSGAVLYDTEHENGDTEGCGSVSPPPTVNGMENEDDVLAAFLGTIKPVMVENIKANSVTITCTPLDFSLLDYSQLEKHADIKDGDLEYFVCCGESVDKQRIFNAGSAPQLTLQLVELRPNTEYLVCTQVGYGDLKGKQSESVTFRTAKSQPEPPEAPRLVARTKNSLAVKWLPSRCDNGAKILRYIVEHDQGQNDDSSWIECYRGNDKQLKITRLQPNTTYRIRVYAENELGPSVASPILALSTAGVPPPQPEPPRIVEVTAHHVVFEWTRRPCDDTFVLQLEDPTSGHGFLTTYSGPETFCSCKDLNRVTDYKVRLSTENCEGVSPFSNIVSITTRPDLPRAPSKPYIKGKASPNSFRVQWDPPSDTGGESISHYVVECTGTDGFRLDHSGPESQLLVSSVEPGETYFVRVHACNSAGQGAYSDVCMVHTPPVAPGGPAPPVLVGKPKATGVTLRWDPPKYTGGEPIASYELKKIIHYDGYSPENDGVVVYYGPAKENHVEGLSAGKVYLFLVRAYNSVGPGPWSGVAQVETGAGPPDAPESLRLQAKNASTIMAAWKEPWSNGAPVTDYKLEMAEESDEQSFLPVYNGAKTSHEIKNLKPNTQYFFRLAASNAAGHGPFSPPYSCWTPPACPGSIQSDKVTHLVSATAITIFWTPPEDNGSPITGYKVEFEHQLRIVDKPVPQCLLDGLQPDTLYKIRIQATNGIGDGPFSQHIRIKTKPVVPDIPKLEVVSVSHNSIKVKWTNVVKNNVEVDYVLEMAFNKKDVFQTVYRGSQTSHKLNKVREETLYFFRVRAVNEAGDSPQSEIVECRTPKSPPPAIKVPKIVPTDDCCQVQWVRLPQCDGEDISYVLQVSKSGGSFLEVYKGSDNSYKFGKLEPGVPYQFRVKPVRVLSDARSIPGSWSPVANYTLPLVSSGAGATSKDSSSVPGVNNSPSSVSFPQRLWRAIDLKDERVAIALAGFCILCCVIIISSYILMSN